jgi:hypothetical protein
MDGRERRRGRGKTIDTTTKNEIHPVEINDWSN